MRLTLILFILAAVCVVGIDALTEKNHSQSWDGPWFKEKELVRFEMGTSCPLYFPKDDS